MGKPKLSTEKIKQIVFLRSHGHSILEINKQVKAGKGTISRYIQGVKILLKYQKILKEKQGGSKQRSKIKWQESALVVKHILGDKLSAREKLLIMSCLYWGEGNKTELNLMNSDPGLIKVFIKCLEEIGVTKDRLRITLRMYEDMDKTTVIKYWSNLIGIPRSSILNVNILKGKKEGKLKYGMCRIRVTKGDSYFKMMMSVVDLLRTYFNAPVVQWIEQDTPKV